ncbi:hypothetical protein R3W88_031753 [Solanum pinnatisectum]|uniref:Uncharacterized protein n=1 Tax=Solanum pinnatisectum TaxID=50273 RepID=A0AAV9LMA2_9SOLN|nr:hypothetical protein R3W88_031753 [Solanum pinnatisectum]
MSGYAKFMKDLVTKKRAVSFDFSNDVHHCSAIATKSLVQKKEDPRRALVDVERGELQFRLNKDEVKFNICRSMKQPNDMNVVSAIEVVADEDMMVSIEERMDVETLAVVLMNFDADFQSNYIEIVNALQGMGAHSYAPKKLDLDLKNRLSPPAKQSIKEPPVLELK